ncbi:MAG: hypothetical protein QOF08_1263 [Gaiellales bacterium]|nr:hypothetical protein [Gaiellales bacterium]
MYLPSLYKARKVPTKQNPCAICVDRTRGRTQRVTFGYGVEVWLCGGHASVEFLTQRAGRDLVVTLSGIWQANGCMTASRHRALDAHLASLRVRSPRPRPGSYAWPRLRVQCERLFAAGVPLARVTNRVLAAEYRNAEPPSERTISRWRSQRRWVRPPPAEVTASPPQAVAAPARPGSRPGTAPA